MSVELSDGVVSCKVGPCSCSRVTSGRVSDAGELTQVLADIVAKGGPEASRRIGETCISLLSVDRAAITMMAGPDRQEPVWASDAVAARLDELQFGLGEGPCVQAFSERRPVLVPNLADVSDSRWPTFATEAMATPVRAVYVFPIQVGAIAVGVLDLYRDDPGMLDTDVLGSALQVADAALWGLLDSRDDYSNNLRADGPDVLAGFPLRHAAVYQATGMIMVQIDSTPGSALAALRAYAYAHNRPIAQAADDVVARRLRFDEETS